MLFNQARKRLAFGGCMYVLFSTDSDLDLLGNLIRRAGFAARWLPSSPSSLSH
jgi:hypothetical protein